MNDSHQPSQDPASQSPARDWVSEHYGFTDDPAPAPAAPSAPRATRARRGRMLVAGGTLGLLLASGVGGLVVEQAVAAHSSEAHGGHGGLHRGPR